jgi:hypothetical protein
MLMLLNDQLPSVDDPDQFGDPALPSVNDSDDQFGDPALPSVDDSGVL